MSGAHDEIVALLPWYLSRTLSRDETETVERHLRGCEGCRAELEGLARLKGAVAAAVEARPGAAPDLFARVAARAAAPAGRDAPTRPWWEPLVEWTRGLMAPRLAPALALGLIVLQLGALGALGTRLLLAPDGLATTQSGPDAPGPAGAVALRVAFQEAATEREIRQALQAAGARIVAGPSAAGFYVVSVPAGPEAARAVEALRRAPVFRLVEEIPRR